MSWSFGGGDGLSTEDARTLKYFYYDESDNTLKAIRTLETEPSTLGVGNHYVSSGGENVFFTNATSNIDWHPSWTGVKDQSIAANQDETGVIPPTFRHRTSDVLSIESNGAVNLGGNPVDYELSSVIPFNAAIMGQDIYAGEPVASDDWLFYSIEDPQGREVYRQTLTGQTLSQGDKLTWWFNHPLEAFGGAPSMTKLWIAKGNQDAERTIFKAMPGTTDTSQRYVKAYYRTFEDYDVMSGVIYTESDQKIRYAATYAVNTSGGSVELEVNSNVGYRSFTVFDAAQSLNPTQKCIVKFDEGQGDAVLQSKNDSYLFYYVPTESAGSRWRYLDLNTKNGGVV